MRAPARRQKRQFARRLATDENGLAMMEFAFSLPVLLVLTLGGLETANFALAHLRISQIAMTVSDNAGRVNTAVDETNINEIFSGARLVGLPIDFENNGRVVLSSLQPNELAAADAGQMINWQRCFGGLDAQPSYGDEGAGREDSSLAAGMGEDGNLIAASEGTAVMFVEVTYQYQPLIDSIWIGGDRDIRYESAFNVRERTNQDITNTQTLPVNQCGEAEEEDDGSCADPRHQRHRHCRGEGDDDDDDGDDDD